MAPVDGNEQNTSRVRRYETPTFDPRSAFAWTLRSGEIARLARRRRQNQLPDPSELASNEPDMAQVAGGEKTSRALRYETPTFDPRGAFAWTLRSGEIARLERQQRLSDSKQLDLLVAAS